MARDYLTTDKTVTKITVFDKLFIKCAEKHGMKYIPNDGILSKDVILYYSTLDSLICAFFKKINNLCYENQSQQTEITSSFFKVMLNFSKTVACRVLKENNSLSDFIFNKQKQEPMKALIRDNITFYIGTSFTWCVTKQGHEYWAKIQNIVKKLTFKALTTKL